MASEPETQTAHVTTLLLAWRDGDEGALALLVPLVHRADHTLQPTALVNEVYLRLVDMKSVRWNDRAHFFALSARLMRRILVDVARSHKYQKRGGGAPTILLEDDLATYGRLIGGFLAGLDRGREQRCAIGRAPSALPASPETHIFHGHRLDYDLVVQMVPPGASVLDLGCGAGELLTLLRERGHEQVVGVELDEGAIVACVERGHDVVQADLDAGLAAFENDQFDVAILSQTLQAIEDVSGMLDELVRVARHAIVSFPNFAHRPLREMFYREGRIPKSEGPYGYEWYDSPNRRFPSIRDFEELCAAKGLTLARRLYIDTASGARVETDPNLNADMEIVMLERA